MNPRAGGACQGVRNLASRVYDPGTHVEVVCLDDSRAEYLSNETVAVRAIGAGRGLWHYHPALRAWLKENLSRFDAIILNGLWQYPGYVLSQLAGSPGMPPYYVFPHGMLDPWFQRAPERRLKAIRNWLYWKAIERRVIANAEAVFFTCDEEMRLARETFRPYRPKRQITIGYGVAKPPHPNPTLDEALQKNCPGLAGRPYLLFLGRIHPKKGIDLLLRAYSKVYCGGNSRQSPPASLIIAGPGLETTYGKDMMALAAAICSPGSVHWPGMLSGDSKWGALYNAEAFVLPSHQENFGIAVAEALSCSTPVLISNRVNIWREIKEDNAGLMSADTLAGTLEMLKQWKSLPPEQRSAMRNDARRCFASRFAIEKVAAHLVDVVGQTSEASRKSGVPQSKVEDLCLIK